MIPTHQHISFGHGKRKCGDKIKSSYIDDSEYQKLPICEKCFPDGRYSVQIVELDTVKSTPPSEKILGKKYLRDYQK
tara:strand:+ start:499 stop:729 length:231 start_codon:yes stop_codon:yes gene_type:complete